MVTNKLYFESTLDENKNVRFLVCGFFSRHGDMVMHAFSPSI